MRKNYLRYTLLIIFITWMIFAVIKTFHSTYSPIILILFFIEGLIALFAALASSSKRLFIHLVIFGYIFSNILLTIFDQMGTYDFITLGLYLVAMIQSIIAIYSLIKNKKTT